MAQKRMSFAPFFIVGCIFIMFAFMALVRNFQHADTKHTESISVRYAYNNGLCEGTELWFSPARGTVLVLCGIPESREWGGMIFRVTENNGKQWLGNDAYECSVFTAKREYWTRVITRDSYIPLGNYPDIERLFREWYN